MKKILKSEQRSHGICLKFHTWQNSPHGENLSGQKGQKLNRFMIAFHKRWLFNKIVIYVFMGSGVVQKKNTTEMLQTPDTQCYLCSVLSNITTAAPTLKRWLYVRHRQSTSHTSSHLMLSVTLRSRFSLPFSFEATEAWRCKINLPIGTQLVKWWS